MNTYKLLPMLPTQAFVHGDSGSSLFIMWEGTNLPAPGPWNQASTAKSAFRLGRESKHPGAFLSKPSFRTSLGTLNIHSHQTLATATDI